MIPNTVQGAVAGTGAVIQVLLGFQPDYVLVQNRNTGQRLEWFRTAGTTGGSVKTVSAGTITVVTGAASISGYDGANGSGFTIPADAQVNVNGQQIDYFASRSAPGAL